MFICIIISESGDTVCIMYFSIVGMRHTYMFVCKCVCVCVLMCVFASLFLLSIHLQRSNPSICRLPSPTYHLSSFLSHSSHPILLYHLSLFSHQASPQTISSLSPTQSPILDFTLQHLPLFDKNHASVLSMFSAIKEIMCLLFFL